MIVASDRRTAIAHAIALLPVDSSAFSSDSAPSWLGQRNTIIDRIMGFLS